MYQGKDVSGQRSSDLALLEHQSAVAFPPTPTPEPTFGSSCHNSWGSDRPPLSHQESRQHDLGGLKGNLE